MNISQSLGDVWAAAYYGLLAFNVVVGITCLVAGPKDWARLLCVITNQINMVLLGAALGIVGCATIADFGLELRQFVGLVLPVLVEFFALITISRWRLDDPLLPWQRE